MTNNRTLKMVVLLSIFVARSHTRVFKAETFMEGSNVTLKCGDAKVKWNELIFITWNLSMQGRKCFVGMLSKPESNCNDGKMILNSSNRIDLFIPKISKGDEGSYSCDISYSAGTYAETVNVSVGVPNLDSQLEFKNVLSDHKLPWGNIAIAVGSVCFIIVSLALVYVLRRKLNNLSALKILCCKSKISSPAEDKPTQAPDVEEVEPYASYIQRVNSIYNSSAELFNA
ncbi:uncharacterized protein si:ch211-214p13.9 isoform X2 [Xyrauchen texanus]|uniref:uncharacterized protein si:ch211-214p13.9 isoform X2 n=1 Tax=Xyrauchen texanus TaxID=154827 RepID=UPI002242B096|nr:uncharacterized protein si:ch211-214p13.9 isoform X2 [Xyrauchen texanus]